MPGIAPRAHLVDLTHGVPAGDVRQAAFRLWQAFPHMPRGTVFLAVVDPGVGTSRRPIAVNCDGFFCVGPDNGIFTYLLEGRGVKRAVEIKRFDTRSNTFHGRDVFAPAAGLLALGTDITKLGPEAFGLVKVPLPRLSYRELEKSVHGETMFADGFGNFVTSIGALIRMGDVVRLDPWIPGCPPLVLPFPRLRIQLGTAWERPVASTFADVPPGEALAYIGSDNLLEIGVNQGSAADSLTLTSGMQVSLTWD